jgi:hypothetical protein
LVRLGEVKIGLARLGEVTIGLARLGKVRLGLEPNCIDPIVILFAYFKHQNFFVGHFSPKFILNFFLYNFSPCGLPEQHNVLLFIIFKSFNSHFLLGIPKKNLLCKVELR